MNIKRALGGAAIAALASLGFAGTALAHGEGTLTCSTATGKVGGIIARVDVRVDGVTVVSTPDRSKDAIPDQDQADAGTYTFSLTFGVPVGDHTVTLWDIAFGDIYNGRDGNLIEGAKVNCHVPEPTTTTVPPSTTVPVSTTTTVPVTTVPVTTVPGVSSSEVATTATQTTVPVSVASTAPAVTDGSAVVTDTPTENTLPATGSNQAPLILAGVLFLGGGAIALGFSHRRRPISE